MNSTAIFINIFAFSCLIVALIKDRAKTMQSLIVAVISFFRIIPTVLIIILFIGLLLGFVPPSEISKIAGEQSGFSGVFLVALLEAILHIPALISFPLAAGMGWRWGQISGVEIKISD